MNKAIATSITVAALLLSGCSGFGHRDVAEVDVTDFGIYVPSRFHQHSVDGEEYYFGFSHEVELVEETDEIPGEIGTLFGARYVPHGMPNGSGVECRVVWIYPEPGLVHPETGQRHRIEARKQYGRLERGHFTGFQLTREWEILPGEWKLMVFDHRDTLLFEQTFFMLEP